jgi:DNA-3-methyladenine glycosylase II
VQTKRSPPFAARGHAERGHETLDERTLARGVRQLARLDPDLARVHRALGLPPLWARAPGFPTLVHIILEQQVSLASARAAFARLTAAVAPLTPHTFLTLDDATLKQIGFSRQKTGYCRLLARAIESGALDLPALARLSDEEVRAALLRLKGVGAWTAEIYLLMALRRADAWPAGDLALAVAYARLKRLPARPTVEELLLVGERWRPLRAVAARLLWHYYLAGTPVLP